VRMLLYPLPTTSRDHLHTSLVDLTNRVSNLRSSHGQARDRLTDYIEWASTAGTMLRTQISPPEVDRLVWTPRYQFLASKVGMLYPDLENSGLHHVLNAELADRFDDFTAAHQALARRIKTWSRPGTFVAFDTNVYIEGDKLEELDVHGLLGLTSPDGPVTLLVPMTVVDELDNLKKSRDAHTRWRALYTTAVLHRVLKADPAKPAPLHPDTLSVMVELLPDPPGHTRLQIADDEIIDRVAKAQVLAGRTITLVTYDTGQALRAGIAGLEANRLPNAGEDDPEPPPRPAKAKAQSGRN